MLYRIAFGGATKSYLVWREHSASITFTAKGRTATENRYAHAIITKRMYPTKIQQQRALPQVFI